MLFRAFLILTGLIALLAVACGESVPEITVDDVDVTLDAKGNAFAIQSQLTPEQRSGNADVLIAYGAVTHLAKDGPASRIPGRVIGWMADQVEVVYPGQGGDEYIKVWVSYGDDFDPADLHDDKENIASCRYSKVGNWPGFKECSKVN